MERWNELRKYRPSAETVATELKYVEPAGNSVDSVETSGDSKEEVSSSTTTASSSGVIKGKVQRLGDFIDTDAVCSSCSGIYCRLTDR